ncbi:uncharacterized protein LOC126785689 [Argentina anserina]|uniref:uncharacterized protein LOC126785689 n=1 Tax=Argentina anserina TaxID=57926 RepID=UPI0021766BD8|nr:uncharacterized protein LOC126785689 [Potentilla anserina]
MKIEEEMESLNNMNNAGKKGSTDDIFPETSADVSEFSENMGYISEITSWVTQKRNNFPIYEENTMEDEQELEIKNEEVAEMKCNKELDSFDKIALYMQQGETIR